MSYHIVRFAVNLDDMVTWILIILGLIAVAIYLVYVILYAIYALFVVSIDAVKEGQWWGFPVLLALVGGVIYLLGLIFWWW